MSDATCQICLFPLVEGGDLRRKACLFGHVFHEMCWGMLAGDEVTEKTELACPVCFPLLADPGTNPRLGPTDASGSSKPVAASGDGGLDDTLVDPGSMGELGLWPETQQVATPTGGEVGRGRKPDCVHVAPAPEGEGLEDGQARANANARSQPLGPLKRPASALGTAATAATASAPAATKASAEGDFGEEEQQEREEEEEEEGDEEGGEEEEGGASTTLGTPLKRPAAADVPAELPGAPLKRRARATPSPAGEATLDEGEQGEEETKVHDPEIDISDEEASAAGGPLKRPAAASAELSGGPLKRARLPG